jgi:hypothetical protein
LSRVERCLRRSKEKTEELNNIYIRKAKISSSIFAFFASYAL